VEFPARGGADLYRGPAIWRTINALLKSGAKVSQDWSTRTILIYSVIGAIWVAQWICGCCRCKGNKATQFGTPSRRAGRFSRTAYVLSIERVGKTRCTFVRFIGWKAGGQQMISQGGGRTLAARRKELFTYPRIQSMAVPCHAPLPRSRSHALYRTHLRRGRNINTHRWAAMRTAKSSSSSQCSRKRAGTDHRDHKLEELLTSDARTSPTSQSCVASEVIHFIRDRLTETGLSFSYAAGDESAVLSAPLQLSICSDGSLLRGHVFGVM